MKVLSLGSSGKLGSTFLQKSVHDVIPTSRNPSNKSIIRFDPEIDSIDKISKIQKFDTAIIFMAISDPIECYKNQEKSHRVNITRTIEIIDSLIELQTKIIFCSSEMVYQGTKGYYSETDKTEPTLLYGKQKLFIENYLTKKYYEKSTILRIAKTYSLEFEKKTIFTKWWQSLTKYDSQPIECPTDQYFSPIHDIDLIQIIDKTITTNVNGVLNIGGPERLSRLDCLLKLYDHVQLPTRSLPTIRKTKINNLGLPEQWPTDLSLNIDKMSRVLEVTPKTVDSFLENYIHKFNQHSFRYNQSPT